ncbi:hypothetical protein G4Y79_02110 [Phototrophicus methaneseepsis]|uniref:Uncharacterized protein n=1 Tax=Phototrophicus methaneseepsis TaxID=2710758 RepID=A0A7S8EA76_9CHLR|nr:hypothetical protein [Phototrophicus methaneseepsis]QPC83192.1 hypothetical protein G4Y79_02110 [Phototrophicus methaneseepsis]
MTWMRDAEDKRKQKIENENFALQNCHDFKKQQIPLLISLLREVGRDGWKGYEQTTKKKRFDGDSSARERFVLSVWEDSARLDMWYGYKSKDGIWTMNSAQEYPYVKQGYSYQPHSSSCMVGYPTLSDNYIYDCIVIEMNCGQQDGNDVIRQEPYFVIRFPGGPYAITNPNDDKICTSINEIKEYIAMQWLDRQKIFEISGANPLSDPYK